MTIRIHIHPRAPAVVKAAGHLLERALNRKRQAEIDEMLAEGDHTIDDPPCLKRLDAARAAIRRSLIRKAEDKILGRDREQLAPVIPIGPLPAPTRIEPEEPWPDPPAEDTE